MSLLLSSLLGLAQPKVQEERDVGKRWTHLQAHRVHPMPTSQASRGLAGCFSRANSEKAGVSIQTSLGSVIAGVLIGILDMDFQSPAELVLRKRWPLGQAVAFSLCHPMCVETEMRAAHGVPAVSQAP